MLKRLKSYLTFWERETPSKRQYRRWFVDLSALVEIDGTTHYCTIKDISPRGACISLIQDVLIAEEALISVDIEGYGLVPARVAHAKGGILRVMFLHGDDGEEALAHWLLWLKPQRRQTRHACHIQATLSVLEREYSCTVVNLSRNGAGISMKDTSHLTIASDVVLNLPNYGSIAASVRHIDRDTVGLVLIDGYLGDLPPKDSSSETNLSDRI